MKRTESEEERNDLKKAIKGRHIIIPIWLTFSNIYHSDTD